MRTAVVRGLGVTAVAATVILPTAAAAVRAQEALLPPRALRGPAHLLRQFPEPALATRSQRQSARRLRAAAERAARAWRRPAAAAAAGFATTRPQRRPGERRVMWFHAEHRLNSADRSYLDPRRPEVLIYADLPGRPLVLVGVMFSVPRGVRGANPGGPITRWHTHRVCADGGERGLAPRPDGTCPRATKSRYGSEMLHLWFTRDLRSSYAVHAPVCDLGAAGLLPRTLCRSTARSHGM